MPDLNASDDLLTEETEASLIQDNHVAAQNQNENENENENENVKDLNGSLQDKGLDKLVQNCSTQSRDRREEQTENIYSENSIVDGKDTVESLASLKGSNTCNSSDSTAKSAPDDNILAPHSTMSQSGLNKSMGSHSKKEYDESKNLEDTHNNVGNNFCENDTIESCINHTEDNSPTVTTPTTNLVVVSGSSNAPVNQNEDDRINDNMDSEEAISDNTNTSNNDSINNSTENVGIDRNGQARTRWIRINQRFQMLLTLVTLFFSILLFCILVCWVVFTSAFVMSIDHPCDVKLKMYFWLATMQLILDLFRSDIMLYVFRWDSRAHRSYPPRVLVYNLCYIVYAIMVLRLGMQSVFFSPDSTCPRTAPELYQTAAVFISLSLGVWFTILFGYVLPFICVIVILTRNGYAPTSDMPAWGNVFPSSNRGAPDGTIDLLKVIQYEESNETECCICMEEFQADDAIVMTDCKHVFHRKCCQEWLQHSRTCPVCRTDLADPPTIITPISSNQLDHELIAAEEGIAIGLDRPIRSNT